LSVGIGMAVLGFYHPFLLGFDILLLGCMAFLILVLGRGAIKTAIKESKSKYYIAGWLEDVARCQTTFTSAAGKGLSASRSDHLVHDYLVNRKKHFRVLFRQIAFALTLQALASTALLGLGGYLVVIGELTLGQLVAAELIVAVIVGAFAKIGKHLESFYDLCASVDKLGALFDLPLARQGTILQSIEDAPPKIELESLCYKRGSNANSTSNLSVVVPGGSSLALLGGVASGKSTILDLIYGHRRPSSGQVKVDGVQPADLQSDDFWNHVELVRHGEIFAGSIEENVHLQRNDVSGEDVDRALDAVGLSAYVNNLPDGLSTPLASHGAPLSPGSLQLLLLARAIAANPSLLLIDSVLDGLPDEECREVLNYLTDPERSWTLVIATGRESIAELCIRTLQVPTGQLLQSSMR
ncbi:MAG: ABC transporter ATP-binding protein, partial [Planctomycetota bacterium]